MRNVDVVYKFHTISIRHFAVASRGKMPFPYGAHVLLQQTADRKWDVWVRALRFCVLFSVDTAARLRLDSFLRYFYRVRPFTRAPRVQHGWRRGTAESGSGPRQPFDGPAVGASATSRVGLLQLSPGDVIVALRVASDRDARSVSLYQLSHPRPILLVVCGV